MVFGLGTSGCSPRVRLPGWHEFSAHFGGDVEMSEINVQLKNGEPIPMPDSATVAEALKKLDRDVAKQALAAKVAGREVDLNAPLEAVRASNGDSVQIEPIVPQTRDGLEVLRHPTAHLLAAA